MLTDDDKRWMTERLRVELTEQLDSVRVEFSERLEKLETTLLTEFHKWASPVEMRQRSHAAALRAMDEEVESLADRLKKLEGR